MGIRFTVDTSGLTAPKEQLARRCKAAEHTLAVQAMKDTAPFVPYRNGVFERMTRVSGNCILYPGPYARFLYYGKVMVDPATGSSYAPKDGTKVLTDRNLVFSKSGNPQAQSHWFEASKAQNLDKWLNIAKKEVQRGKK